MISLILICSRLITPDVHDCTRDTAMQVIVTTGAAHNMCGLIGSQAHLASTVIGREMRDDEYVRIVCEGR
jgi:hypothetical protein